MSDAPAGRTTPQLRVGDRERREVDERLIAAVGDGVLTLAEYDERAAVLWQARTRAELDELVADLPATGAVAAPPRPVTGPAVPPGRVVAVMSEDRFAGALVPGQDVRGYALMGKAVLDLRRQDLPDGVRVRVRSLMGEVEVLVPPGSVVHLSGLSFMGERKVEVAQGAGPAVHVDAVAVMGSVRVGIGDGTVVAADGRPAVAPAQRATSVAVPPSGAVARRSGHLRRVLDGTKGLLVPLAIVGAIVLAGPDARSVFGSTVERVGSDNASVEVSTLFGNVTVVVPDGAQVTTSGLVVFGSTDCTDACGPRGEDASGGVVDVRGVGAFGSIEVLTESEYEGRQDREDREERAEDAREAREEAEEDDEG